MIRESLKYINMTDNNYASDHSSPDTTYLCGARRSRRAVIIIIATPANMSHQPRISCIAIIGKQVSLTQYLLC
jgi:hypothetical protein